VTKNEKDRLESLREILKIEMDASILLVESMRDAANGMTSPYSQGTTDSCREMAKFLKNRRDGISSTFNMLFGLDLAE
jgi:hypothetical protein